MAEGTVNVLARNLKSLMDEHLPKLSQNELGKKTGVGQTSIGLMLNPEKRLPTKSGRIPSPTLAQIEKVAAFFHKEAWQLLHPNPAQAPLSESERKRYEAFENAMKQLQEPPSGHA